MTDVVEEFVLRFKHKNLTVKRLKKLSVDQTRFHLFGTWNELRIENGELKHFQMETGGKFNEVANISLSELKETCYIPYTDSFILFKEDKKRCLLEPEYVYTKISMFSPVDEKRKFLNERGFKIMRKVLNLDLNSKYPYLEVEVF